MKKKASSPKKTRTTPRKRSGKEQAVGFAIPRGMKDIVGEEWAWRDRIESVVRGICDTYRFKRIETPVLEQATLFKRGVGEKTDIVEKELYAFRTKGRDYLALRPEGTAPVVRMYIENRLDKTSPLQKLWYISPMFRHDRPQAGRYRQFWQVGLEVLGGADPLYDAEVILLYYRMLEELRVKNIVLKLNSMGCRSCRPSYVKELEKYYKKHSRKLCPVCQRRLKTNPLRLLDCKDEKCAGLKASTPNILNKLCGNCCKHFTSVLEYVDEMDIPYIIENTLVRGLDYYSRTVFEIFVEQEGEESKAVAGGGRYDYLFDALGARATPAVGGAMGVERLIDVMKSQGVPFPGKPMKRVFLIHVGDAAKKKMLGIMETLRAAGIGVAESLSKDSLAAQLKVADKEGVKVALILGKKEVFEECIIVRNLKESTQESVPMRQMVNEVKKRLK